MYASDRFVVEQVWRYPVKSLGGERTGQSWTDGGGLLGDRVWAVQAGDGKLGSGKNTRRFRRVSGLLELSARYPAGPGPAGIEPPVITGPDGDEHRVASGAADAFLRRFTGVRQLHVRRETGVTHFDQVKLTLIGTATVSWLSSQLPGVPVDARRLRANLVVRTAEPFIEESWLGKRVSMGTGEDAVHAVFDRVLERCVMVGMAQPGLPRSGEVLKAIARREVNPLCLAIGGHIVRDGLVHAGTVVVVSR